MPEPKPHASGGEGGIRGGLAATTESTQNAARAARAERTHAERQRAIRADRVLLVALGIGALGCIAAFLTIGVTGNIAYVFERRSTTVLALVLVGVAIAVSTVTFQTVTANRILTPSIMGFDALYMLIQTSTVYVFGATGLAAVGAQAQFWVQVALMLGFAVVLYGWLLSTRIDVNRLLLIGVVFGMLFRGISSFMQRMLSPDAFAALQDRFFATFTGIPADILLPGAALLLVGISAAAYDRRRLDVMALGRDIATSLGVDPRRLRMRTLASTALLISVSTALVGPVTFFGLIVAHLAYRFVRVARHSVLLPAASLMAVIALVGGQTIIERIAVIDVQLSVVIEFLGGLLFILLILRRKPL